MRMLLPLRAARASIAGSLALSLGLAPACAHFALSGPAGHAWIGRGHGSPPTLPGFSRFGRNAFAWSGRNGWNGWRGPYWSGWGRYGWNHYGWGGYGSNGWNAYPGWDGFGAGSPAGPAFVLGGVAPPFSVTVVAGPVASVGDPAGCVIHKLEYDGAGNYVGDRQSSHC